MTQDQTAAALKRIAELSKPGQELSLRNAIDILCDIWNEAKRALDDSSQPK